MRPLHILLASSLLAGCGGSVDRNIEGRVTLSQGVYGQTIDYNDVAPGSFEYMSEKLRVFAAPRGDSAAIAETTSDDRGFYEIQLETGDFEICINADRTCHAFTIAEQARIRLDYQSFEPGWWEGQIPD